MDRFAHAILIADDRYVLQLRDDKPQIAAPGMWSFFGGKVEKDETPQEAVVREVWEEIGLRLDAPPLFFKTEEFSTFWNAVVGYNFFESDCTASWSEHTLREGRDARAFRFEETTALPMTELSRRVLTMHHQAKEQ